MQQFCVTLRISQWLINSATVGGLLVWYSLSRSLRDANYLQNRGFQRCSYKRWAVLLVTTVLQLGGSETLIFKDLPQSLANDPMLLAWPEGVAMGGLGSRRFPWKLDKPGGPPAGCFQVPPWTSRGLGTGAISSLWLSISWGRWWFLCVGLGVGVRKQYRSETSIVCRRVYVSENQLISKYQVWLG